MNPNSKDDLIGIIERLFEEVETLPQPDDDFLNEIEKLQYEFKNGSK